MRFAHCVVLITALAAAPAYAQQAIQADPRPDADAAAFFEKKVRPVLATNCFKCHSSTSEKLKGGLKVDSREALLQGGESGPAVVPGKPDESPLIEAVRYDHDDLQMPPKQKLPQGAISDLEKWVEMGAPWGPSGPAGTTGAAVGGAAALARPASQAANYEKLRREHWAWQPVKPAQPPSVKDAAWPKDDVDRFVLAKLEAAGLEPVGRADRATLIRRVTFDLIGLPPTPREVDAFVNDPTANAFEKVVDRLLASQQFGERWGRHWLDVARYGESTGSTRNYPYPWAWRYRDYVIDSFNRDKPFDRFVTEQVAGDLLPYASSEQRNEQLCATGLLALGIKDLNERDPVKFTMDNVDEQIDVVGRAVLATTISCARCHDHKFDPIPTADYYALAGIFRSTQILSGYAGRRGGNKDLLDRRLLARLGPTGADAQPTPPVAQRDIKRATDLAAQLEQARVDLRDLIVKARGGKPTSNVKLTDDANPEARRRRLRKLILDKQATIARLEQELDAADKGDVDDGLLALAVRDVPRPADCPVYLHGETDKRGDVVPRGVIHLLDSGQQNTLTIGPSESGRLELARWLTGSTNPLTARVMVNRIWHHLFGQGLVRTVDNFGTTGEAPSHPELLDYLSARFVRDGWSVKKTIRALVLSRTYQLASTYSRADAAVDPSNQLLWRMAPRRLEAEAIRDAILAVAGTLDLTQPAGSVVSKLAPQEVRGINAAVTDSFVADRRSVYLPILRNNVPAVLDVFDFAEPSMVTGSRDVTTVAPQALFLMNNPLVLEQSRKFAERVLAEKQLTDHERVDLAYRIAFSRKPTGAEMRRVADYIDAFGAASKDAKDVNKLRLDAWATFCQALLASAEFRYVN
jgi:cytochrome c553